MGSEFAEAAHEYAEQYQRYYYEHVPRGGLEYVADIDLLGSDANGCHVGYFLRC